MHNNNYNNSSYGNPSNRQQPTNLTSQQQPDLTNDQRSNLGDSGPKTSALEGIKAGTWNAAFNSSTELTSSNPLAPANFTSNVGSAAMSGGITGLKHSTQNRNAVNQDPRASGQGETAASTRENLKNGRNSNQR